MEGAKAADLIDAIHAESTIVTVDPATLKVDRSYQREPSQQLVDQITGDWDRVSSELLLVSNRGERQDEHGKDVGGLYIVNGQHRTLAATKLGLKAIDARVIDLSKVEDPASIEAKFRLRTNVRMPDKPLERFKAQVRSGDPESVAIVAILDRFDTQANETPNQELGINAIAAVEKLYRTDDTGALLAETLQLMKDTWGFVGGRTTTAAMLSGLAWFTLKHSDEADRGRVVERLNLAGHAAIDRRARTIMSTAGGQLWLNYYRAFVDFYNERLSDNRRLEWRTKGANSFKGAAGRWGAGS